MFCLSRWILGCLERAASASQASDDGGSNEGSVTALSNLGPRTRLYLSPVSINPSLPESQLGAKESCTLLECGNERLCSF